MMLPGVPYLVAGTALIAFLSGWTVHGWKEDAAAKSAAESHNSYLTDLWMRQRKNNQAISKDLASAAADREALRLKLKEVKRNVKPEQLSACAQNRLYLSPLSNRLWNEQLGRKADGQEQGAGVPATSPGTDEAAGGTSFAEALDNHEINAALHSACRENLNKWIDWAAREGLGAPH